MNKYTISMPVLIQLIRTAILGIITYISSILFGMQAESHYNKSSAINEIKELQEYLHYSNNILRQNKDRSELEDIKIKVNSYHWTLLQQEIDSIDKIEYDHNSFADFICGLEGYENAPYEDPTHLDISDKNIGCGILARGRKSMSYEESHAIMVLESKRLSKLIQKTYDRTLSENEMKALVSYTFNTPITQPAIKNKEFINAVENKDYRHIRTHMMKYNAFMSGLKSRRLKELELFKSG